VNANLEGLPDLQGLQAVAAREGLRRGEGGVGVGDGLGRAVLK